MGFMDKFDEKKVVDQIFIEGSNNDFAGSEDIVRLAVISEEVHEGWNQYPLETAAKFNSYRIYANKSCNLIDEIRFFGYEVIDNDDDQYSCPIQVIQIGENSEETEIETGEAITYEVSATPVIDDISPRWGSVTGGTQITFTGRNLGSGNAKDYSINIDDIECTIDEISSTEIKCT